MTAAAQVKREDFPMASDMQQPYVTDRTPACRYWLKFSLRNLLVFITLLACFLSWLGHERSQSKFERQIGEKLREQGCHVEFHGIYDRRFQNGGARVLKNQQGWWRDLARQVLGERIRYMTYRGGPDNVPLLAELSDLKNRKSIDPSVSDRILLAELKNFKTLVLEASSVSDFMSLADLTLLAELEKLESLVLIDMSLGGLTSVPGFGNSIGLYRQSLSDLTPLAELKNLEALGLSIYVDDLTPLAGLSNLKGIRLRAWSVSDEQVESLQHALPNCNITLE